jgi:dienelactone hydrolase
MICTQNVDYRDAETLCKGVLAFDDAWPGPLPGILISHMWSGREEFVEGKARDLANLGYAAFALDMYGEGRRGRTPDECRALMQPLVDNRALLTRRISAALSAMRSLTQVDERRIAALGFCFGGMCVLDLARSGADVRGVISMHGLLKSHDLPKQRIQAKVLALHGNEDPLAPVEDMVAFQAEMTSAQADWQLHIFGGTRHAFTNPNAANPEAGLMYNPTAERRSWAALLEFLAEVLR